MASIRYDIDPPELHGRRVQSTQSTIASGPVPGGREDFARELRSLYEQLLATRGDLVHGSQPGNGQPSLSRGEYDCVLAHLDSAIVAARSMVAVQRMRGAAANGLEFEPEYRASA